MKFFKAWKVKKYLALVAIMSVMSCAQKITSEREPNQVGGGSGNVGSVSEGDSSKKVKTVKANNVVICAAECQTEFLGAMSRENRLQDPIYIGKIYYAPYTHETKTNQISCLAESKEVEIYVNDKGSAFGLCMNALCGRYGSRAVNIKSAPGRIGEPSLFTIEERK